MKTPKFVSKFVISALCAVIIVLSFALPVRAADMELTAVKRGSPNLFFFPESNSAPNFTLEDQFGNKTSVRFPSDKAVVLVFGDREGSKQVEGWVRPLYDRFGSRIYIFGIAELSAVPKMVRPVVRKIIKSKSPYPVMLDWNGNVSETYGCENGKANVFIIDKAGRISAVKRGGANQNSLREAFQTVNSVL